MVGGVWGACMAEGIHGRGPCMVGVYMAGGVHGRGHLRHGPCMAGGHAWHACHPWQTLQDMVNERAVRILLECILVTVIIVVIFFVNVLCDGNNEMYYINSLQAQM